MLIFFVSFFKEKGDKNEFSPNDSRQAKISEPDSGKHPGGNQGSINETGS
jgi:hypothetical protein